MRNDRQLVLWPERQDKSVMRFDQTCERRIPAAALLEELHRQRIVCRWRPSLPCLPVVWWRVLYRWQHNDPRLLPPTTAPATSFSSEGVSVLQDVQYGIAGDGKLWL